MNLIIELGNTSKKLAVFDKDVLIKVKLFKSINADIIRSFCSDLPVKNAILSSVVQKNSSINAYLKKHFFFIEFTDKTPIPIKNCYRTPETLGKDRLACAVAASELFPRKPVLIIDAGTCIKYDFIDGNNGYLGGAISPGIEMRFSALHTFTAKLPLIRLKFPVELIGTDTKKSILSGVFNGVIAEINETIRWYKKQNSGLKVVLTGGDAVILADKIKSRIFVSPFLVLQGLNIILNYNAGTQT